MIEDKIVERVIGLINRSKPGGGVTDSEAVSATNLARNIIRENNLSAYAVKKYESRTVRVVDRSFIDHVYEGIIIETRAYTVDSTQTDRAGFESILDAIRRANPGWTPANNYSTSQGSNTSWNYSFWRNDLPKQDIDWSDLHNMSNDLEDEEFFQAYAKQVGKPLDEVMRAVRRWTDANDIKAPDAHAQFRAILKHAETLREPRESREPKIIITFKGMRRDIQTISDSELSSYLDEMVSGKNELIERCIHAAIEHLRRRAWILAKSSISEAESIQLRPIGNIDYTKVVSEIERRKRCQTRPR